MLWGVVRPCAGLSDELELGDVPLDEPLARRSVPPGMAESTGFGNGHDDLHRIGHRYIAGLEHPRLGLAKDRDPLTVRVRDHHDGRAVVRRADHGVLDVAEHGPRREAVEDLVVETHARPTRQR